MHNVKQGLLVMSLVFISCYWYRSTKHTETHYNRLLYIHIYTILYINKCRDRDIDINTHTQTQHRSIYIYIYIRTYIYMVVQLYMSFWPSLSHRRTEWPDPVPHLQSLTCQGFIRYNTTQYRIFMARVYTLHMVYMIYIYIYTMYVSNLCIYVCMYVCIYIDR